MGLFDNLFKAKPDAADEAVVEAAKRIAEHEKARLLEASRVSPATPAARSGIVPTAKPAPVVPAPRAYSPRTLGQVVTPARVPQRSGDTTATRKIRFSSHEETTRPSEVVLTVEDVLSRIPMELIRDQPHDLTRELRFKVEDLSADIARGRAAVSLGSIAAQVPELFRESIAREDSRQIRLPLQKLVEQIGFLPIKPTAPAAHAAAPAPAALESSSVLPPPPGPGPTVTKEQAMPPLEPEGSLPNVRISLNLAEVLRLCPRDLIIADLPRISENDRISFPWPPIEKQLRTGVVEVSSVRFIFALPAYLHGYFEAREGIRVPLPLDEIRKNIPGGAGEEMATLPAAEPMAPSVPPPMPDPILPPAAEIEPAVPPVVEVPVAKEERAEAPPSIFAEPPALPGDREPSPFEHEAIPDVVFARRKPAAPVEPPPMPVEPAAPVESAAPSETVAPVEAVESAVWTEPAAPVEPAAVEQSLEQPVIEEPAIEPLAVEQSVIEPPVIELPVVEEPPAEAFVIEPPAAEVSPTELPPIEASLVEVPVAEVPVVEAPILEAETEARPLELPPPLVAHTPPTLSVEPLPEPEALSTPPIPTISEIEAPMESTASSEPPAAAEPVAPPIFVPPPLRQAGDTVAPGTVESQPAPPNVWMQPPPELAARATAPWPPDVAPPPSPILPVRIIAPPVARPIVAPPPLFSGGSLDTPMPAAIPAPEPPAPPPPPPLDLDIARAALGVEGEATLSDLGSVLLKLPGLTACHLIVRHETGSAGELPAGFNPVAVRALAAQLSTALDRSAESLGTGRVQHMTIFTDDGSVSFFTQGEATVCAIHRTRAFLPGVRERLAATATALAHA